MENLYVCAVYTHVVATDSKTNGHKLFGDLKGLRL